MKGERGGTEAGEGEERRLRERKEREQDTYVDTLIGKRWWQMTSVSIKMPSMITSPEQTVRTCLPREVRKGPHSQIWEHIALSGLKKD